jgi:hypothetical protein
MMFTAEEGRKPVLLERLYRSTYECQPNPLCMPLPSITLVLISICKYSECPVHAFKISRL